MLGHNSVPHHIQGADDARIYATEIAACRTEIEAIEAKHSPAIDVVSAQLDEARADRDAETAPHKTRMEFLRGVLDKWLRDDPDMQLKDDGGAVLATLAKAKPTIKIDASKVPKAFMSWRPDEAKIAVALAAGETVKGVTVTKNYSLRVTA